MKVLSFSEYSLCLALDLTRNTYWLAGGLTGTVFTEEKEKKLEANLKSQWKV